MSPPEGVESAVNAAYQSGVNVAAKRGASFPAFAVSGAMANEQMESASDEDVASDGTAQTVPALQNGLSSRDLDEVVDWLRTYIEYAPGECLPRKAAYDRYNSMCKVKDQPELFCARFGRALRMAFPNVSTRRIGRRGESRYQYFGIRFKDGWQPENNDSSSERSPPASSFKADASHSERSGKQSRSATAESAGEASNVRGNGAMAADSSSVLAFRATDARAQTSRSDHGVGKRSDSDGAGVQTKKKKRRPDDAMSASRSSSSGQSAPQASGTSTDGFVLPTLTPMELAQCAPRDPSAFLSAYHDHCEALLHAAREQRLAHVADTVTRFWASITEEHRMLLNLDMVLQNVRDCDVITYSAILYVLWPDVLRSLPAELTQELRMLGRRVVDATSAAMQPLTALAPRLRALKIDTARAFSRALHRATSLNHLAQAARTVLSNPVQMDRLVLDWGTVDFDCLHEQVSTYAGCSTTLMTELVRRKMWVSTIGTLVESFALNMLTKQTSIEAWAGFLTNVFGHCVLGIASHFHLRWSLYGNMFMRDLTLRSATSFGSYHLLRLFFDDYMLSLSDQHFAYHRLLELRGSYNDLVLNGVHAFMFVTLSTLRVLDPHGPKADGDLHGRSDQDQSPTTDAALDLARLAYGGGATPNLNKAMRMHDGFGPMLSPVDGFSPQRTSAQVYGTASASNVPYSYALSPPHGTGTLSSRQNLMVSTPSRHLGDFGHGFGSIDPFSPKAITPRRSNMLSFQLSPSGAADPMSVLQGGLAVLSDSTGTSASVAAATAAATTSFYTPRAASVERTPSSLEGGSSLDAAPQTGQGGKRA